VHTLLDLAIPSDHPPAECVETFFGAIGLVISDFRTYLDQTEANTLLHRAMAAFNDRPPELMNSIIDVTRGFIDTPQEPGGYTALHNSVAGCLNSVGQLIENGADLHPIGQDDFYSFRSETPTSIAIMSSLLSLGGGNF